MNQNRPLIIKSEGLPKASEEAIGIIDVDIAELAKKARNVLHREIRSLMIESSAGKLSDKSARDLAAYIRLLEEMEKNEKEAASELDDETLKKMGKQA